MIQRELEHVLAALTPPNRLAMEIALATGLRIGDVLALRMRKVQAALNGRLTVRELKTGKLRRIYLRPELRERALSMAGKVFVFEGRLDQHRPRSRQAVYKDLKRAAKLFRVVLQVSPHTARKVYAVRAYARTGKNLARVQKILNHSDPAVTILYALADHLTQNRTPH